MSESSTLPPWQSELHLARERLHAAAFRLRREEAPSVDLRPLAVLLEQAVERLFDAFDDRSDRASAVRASHTALSRANETLASCKQDSLASARAELDEAARALERCERDLQNRPVALPTPPGDGRIVASGDGPQHHELSRTSLRPTLDFAAGPEPQPEADPKPLRPRTFAELDANIAMMKDRAHERRRDRAADKRARTEADPDGEPVETAWAAEGFGPDIPERQTEEAFVQSRTREMLEEVAMVGMQRAPLDGDLWRTSLSLEQRMLRAIDAVASMGPVGLRYVEPWAMDAPVKLPSRLFAVAMTMGCFSGYDALGVVERVHREYAAVDPSCDADLTEALSLVPEGQLPSWIRQWLGSATASHRAWALDVLCRRRLATNDELMRAASDEPIVATVALPWLALRDPEGAEGLLAHLEPPTDPGLRLAFWRAMMLVGDPRLSTVLRGALGTEQQEPALQWLGVSADENDARWLLEIMQQSPTPAVVAAVGWAGAVAAIAPLIDLLEGGDEALAVTAAAALDRITHAGLMEEAELDTEEIMVSEPPVPDVGEPKKLRLVRVVSDPRDLPPEPSKESIHRPTTSAAAWRAWQAEHAAEWPTEQRYRLGRPYAPNLSLQELDLWPRSVAERQLLIDELVIRTGHALEMSPQQWVVDQLRAIDAFRPVAGRASSQPGGWSRPGRKA